MIKIDLPFPHSWLLADDDLFHGDPLRADRIVIEPRHLATAMELPDPIREKIFLQLDTEHTESAAKQIDHAVRARLGGLVITSPCRRANIQKADVMLSAAEAEAGLDVGSLRIVALAANDPADVLALAGFDSTSARLIALGGAGETLRRRVNARTQSAEPVRQARGLLLLATSASGIAALADVEYGLTAGEFEAACRRDKDDGFAGKLALTATQAETVKTIFARQAF